MEITIPKTSDYLCSQRGRAPFNILASAFVFAGLLPFSVLATTTVNILFPNGEYTENSVDMRVAATGGPVTLDRDWKNNRWHINSRWSNLTFRLDPLDGAVKTVERSGALFERSGDSSLYIFEQVFIRKTDAGWRWYDRKGNWIIYDDKGRITAYGDANDVGGRFTLDAEGRRTAVHDHFNQLVYQFNYDSEERLIKVTDRSGRSVHYQWSGERLMKVTDVAGNEYLYNYDANGQLTQRTEPDGRSVKIGYTSSVKAPTTAMISGQKVAFPLIDALASNKTQTAKVARVGKFTNINGAVTLWNTRFDANTKQFTVTEDDPMGKKTVSLYNISGKLLSRQINGEHDVTVAWEGNHIRRITDARGLTTVTHYDAVRHPVKVIYPDGSSITTEYDYSIDKPVKYTDRAGIITEWLYDGKGNLVRRTDAVDLPEQRMLTYHHDTYGQLISITEGSGEASITTTRRYDNAGNITAYTDGEGHTTQYTYTVDGQVKTLTTPLGKVWRYDYSLAGLLTTLTNPLDQTVSYTYDAVGRLTESTDASGHTTRYQLNYESTGEVITLTNPLGQALTFNYDLNDNPLTIESASGLTQSFTHDTEGRLHTLTDPAGNITTLAYGARNTPQAGLLTKAHYPTFNETYAYDRIGQTTEVNQWLDEQTASTTRATYNQQGLPVSLTEPGELTSLYEYDAFDNLIKETDATGAVTRQRYDTFGRLATVTDANGNIHQYRYDKNDNLLEEMMPGGKTTLYGYNEDGLLVQKTDAAGNITAYQYNDAGRLINETVTAAGDTTPQQAVIYSYNASGYLTEMIQSGQTDSRFAYIRDALGRTVQENITYGTGSNAFTLTLKYHYDADGNLVATVYPDSTEVTAHYDKGLLQQIQLANGKTIRWGDYRWFAPAETQFPGATRSVEYDALLRPRHIQVSTGDNGNPDILMSRGYTYNAANNIAGRTTEDGDFTYQYDRANRLVQAVPPQALQNKGLPVESYAYDELGNRIGSSHQPGTFHYGDDNQLLQMGIAHNLTQFDYTLNGHIAKETKPTQLREYRYDAADRLTAVITHDTETATYRYDPLGRRISKTRHGETVWYLYSDEGLMAELNERGQMVVAYGWLPDSQWGTQPLWQANLTAGQTLASADYHYLHTDHLGTPQIATDGQGVRSWKAIAEAFGKVILDDANRITMNLRFPGQYYDAETGHHYNTFRDYNPTLGRYQQRDPIGLLGGN